MSKESSQNTKEWNENENATIGFVIHYPYQFYVYYNIYKQITADAEFIVDLRPLPASSQAETLEDVISLLQKKKVAYRILFREDYAFPIYLKRFFARYRALVSVWERGCMNLPETAHIRKIRAAYGAGKELTMVRPSSGLYDLALSYGPRDTTLFSYYTQAEMVGNPKFDDWFTDTVDPVTIREVRKRLDPEKKTILYLPTHSDLSSVDMLADELKKSAETYNVIVKLHYFTTREEPERVALLTDPRLLLLPDSVDLLPLLKVADIVVSDNSSAIFDAVLADKPLLVADFWDATYLDQDHKEIRRYDRGVQGGITYSDSIEQVVKRENTVAVLRTPQEFAARVDDAQHSEYAQKRKILRDMLFAHTDGTSAKRAADAIRRCIESEPAPRPILFHAFEAYKRRMGVVSYTREKMFLRKIGTLESMLGNTKDARAVSVFSIVMLRTGADISNPVRSILLQDRTPADYELLLMDTDDSELHRLSREDADVHIVALGKKTGSLSDRLAHALHVAQGSHILFTTDECVLPSNALAELYAAYATNSDIGGAGGYVMAQNRGSALGKYRSWDISSKLGVESLGALYQVSNRNFVQNPAGDIQFMSYKKDIIEPLPSPIDDVEAMAAAIKWRAMMAGPIAFVPISAALESAGSLRRLAREEYRFGHAARSLLPLRVTQRRRILVSVRKILADFLSAVFMKPLLAPIVLFGRCARWAGQRASYVAIIQRHIELWVRDRER